MIIVIVCLGTNIFILFYFIYFFWFNISFLLYFFDNEEAYNCGHMIYCMM